MTEQEYKAEIQRLKNEIAELKEAYVSTKRKKRRLCLPLEIGAKYGGSPRPKGESIWVLPFIEKEGIEYLSRAIRSSLFEIEKKRVKAGYLANYLKTIESMTDEEYALYSECMDKMLSVLSDFHKEKIIKDGDGNA